MPARQAIDYTIQIARGLAAAHEKHIVHRDLKPDNVCVTRDDQLKILDFGLAKLTQRDTLPEGATALPTTPIASRYQPHIETTPGVVLGTLGYMAPEQVRGADADHRADLFALGAILYEMLTGRRAFRGDSAIETMTAILRDEPPEVADTGSAIPPGLRRVIEHCLEKRPERRFQSAQDVAFALESLSGSSATVVPAEAVAAAHRDRRSAVWLA